MWFLCCCFFGVSSFVLLLLKAMTKLVQSDCGNTKTAWIPCNPETLIIFLMQSVKNTLSAESVEFQVHILNVQMLAAMHRFGLHV